MQEHKDEQKVVKNERRSFRFEEIDHRSIDRLIDRRLPMANFFNTADYFFIKKKCGVNHTHKFDINDRKMFVKKKWGKQTNIVNLYTVGCVGICLLLLLLLKFLADKKKKKRFKQQN